jgi:hypothetical protein
VIAARRLTAILPLAAALVAGGALGCARSTPELRLAVAESVESADLESGSTLAVRGEGFPVGVPAEAIIEGERRSFVHPGSLSITLPAKAVAHDRLEVALDASTTTALLGEGDDDARIAGTLALRFQSSGAVVTTAPVGVALRVRSFPRNARIAAEKRARAREALRSIGVEIGDGLTVVTVAPSVFRRGDVAVGDRLTSLDGISLASEDDVLPPEPLGPTRLEAVGAAGEVHRATGLLGATWLARAAALVALAFVALAFARHVSAALTDRVGAPRSDRSWSIPPSRGSVMSTAAFALAFELSARLVRARVELPILLVLLAIALFGPLRRSVLLAVAFGLATSAALVDGGVFRVDELSGGLGATAVPGLAFALVVWSQRFGGGAATRSAHAALLFVALPLVHVVAPRVGVLPAVGRALAATALASAALPPLQHLLAPLRETVGPWSIALAIAGSLGALGAGVAFGPLPAAIAASGAGALLTLAAFLRAFKSSSLRPSALRLDAPGRRS